MDLAATGALLPPGGNLWVTTVVPAPHDHAALLALPRVRAIVDPHGAASWQAPSLNAHDAWVMEVAAPQGWSPAHEAFRVAVEEGSRTLSVRVERVALGRQPPTTPTGQDPTASTTQPATRTRAIAPGGRPRTTLPRSRRHRPRQGHRGAPPQQLARPAKKPRVTPVPAPAPPQTQTPGEPRAPARKRRRPRTPSPAGPAADRADATTAAADSDRPPADPRPEDDGWCAARPFVKHCAVSAQAAFAAAGFTGPVSADHTHLARLARAFGPLVVERPGHPVVVIADSAPPEGVASLIPVRISADGKHIYTRNVRSTCPPQARVIRVEDLLSGAEPPELLRGLQARSGTRPRGGASRAGHPPPHAGTATSTARAARGSSRGARPAAGGEPASSEPDPEPPPSPSQADGAAALGPACGARTPEGRGPRATDGGRAALSAALRAALDAEGRPAGRRRAVGRAAGRARFRETELLACPLCPHGAALSGRHIRRHIEESHPSPGEVLASGELARFLRDNGAAVCRACPATVVVPEGAQCPVCLTAAPRLPALSGPTADAAEHDTSDATSSAALAEDRAAAMRRATQAALGIHAPTVVRVPKRHRNALAAVVAEVVDLLGPVDAQLAVSALGALLLHAAPSHARLAQELGARLRAWREGAFDALLESARRAAARRDRGRHATDPAAEVRRVVAAVQRSGPTRRAADLLASRPPPATGEAAADAASRLHPPGGRLPTSQPPPAAAPLSCPPEDVRRALRAFPPESAPGPGGLRAEHLRDAIDAPDAVAAAQALTAVTRLVDSALAGHVHAALQEAELVLLPKPAGRGWRPVALLGVLRRLVSRCALATQRGAFGAAMEDVGQYGVGVPDGAAKVAAWAAALTAAGAPTWAIDLDNAFNRVHRDVAYEALADLLPQLAPYAFALLSAPLQLRVRGAPGTRLAVARGVPQGDPLSPLAFAAALATVTRRVRTECDAAGALFEAKWYLDDGLVVATEASFEVFRAALERAGADAGCAVRSCTRGPAAHLGVPLSAEARTRSVVGCTEDLRRVAERLVDHPQVALALVRTCLAPTKRLNHIARVAPPGSVEWAPADGALREALAAIVGLPIGDEDSTVWAQAGLPPDSGGLGVPFMADRHEAIYAGAAAQRAQWLDLQLTAAQRALQGPDLPRPAAVGPPPDPDGVLRTRWLAGATRRPDALHAADVQREGAGAWITAPPIAAARLTVDAEPFRMALRHRLGLHILSDEGRCHACHRPMAADARHALGCDKARATRHNQIRDALAAAWRAAGSPVHTECTVAQACGILGRPPPSTPHNAPPRPIDLLVSRRLRADAPTAACAVDVTVAIATPAAELARQSTDPDAAGALERAYRRKTAVAEHFERAGIHYTPFVVSVNGALHSSAEKHLEDLAHATALVRRLPFSEALMQIKQTIAVCLQRTNGQILLRALAAQADACTRAEQRHTVVPVAVPSTSSDEDERPVPEAVPTAPGDAGTGGPTGPDAQT